MACLADLSTLSLPHNGKNDNAKASNAPGTASNGGFWVSKVLELLDELEKDTKHVNQRRELEAEASEVKDEAYKVVKELKVRFNCVILVKTTSDALFRPPSKAQRLRPAAFFC